MEVSDIGSTDGSSSRINVEMACRFWWFKTFITDVSAGSIGLISAACFQLYSQAIVNYAGGVVFLIAGSVVRCR